MNADITLEQYRNARHALGLPNKQKTSNRNYYVTGEGKDFDLWVDMVNKGYATSGKRLDMTTFWLTQLGAEKSLDFGEKLNPDDFPNSNYCAKQKRKK